MSLTYENNILVLHHHCKPEVLPTHTTLESGQTVAAPFPGWRNNAVGHQPDDHIHTNTTLRMVLTETVVDICHHDTFSKYAFHPLSDLLVSWYFLTKKN